MKPGSSVDWEMLVCAARDAASHAHAPYSDFHVGAAVLTSTGEVFSGCNVENASYGLTNCAERTAIFSAVAKSGPNVVVKAVAVVNDGDVPCAPCGACRQVIFEFGPDAKILFRGPTDWVECPITDLLPYGFRLK
jgi:cytidine deaminase